MTARRALADPSVFIGLEAARFDAEQFADFEWGVSAITLGELRLTLGVLRARIRKLPPEGSRHTIAQGVPIVTQDADYDVMPGVQVIKI